MLQYGWDLGESSPWHFYVNAGPVVSFLLSGKQVAKGTDKMYSDNSGATSLWDFLPPTVQFMITSQFPNVDKALGDPVVYGETNTTGEIRSTNFGVAANIGLRYQHGLNYFFLEAGGNYGFRAVQDNDAFGTNRLGALSVMVGYAFSLF